jgi:hypothetical protein
MKETMRNWAKKCPDGSLTRACFFPSCAVGPCLWSRALPATPVPYPEENNGTGRYSTSRTATVSRCPCSRHGVAIIPAEGARLPYASVVRYTGADRGLRAAEVSNLRSRLALGEQVQQREVAVRGR